MIERIEKCSPEGLSGKVIKEEIIELRKENQMKEKTIIRSVFMPALVLALVMTACAFHLTKSDSYAGSAYKLVTLKENSVKKVGKWYFKEKGNKIYCSKKKKSGYKKFAVHHDSSNAPFDLVTNGKNVIYIYINPNMDRFKLKKYNCSTKKTSNLKTVAKNADCSYIAAVYKNKIYLNSVCSSSEL